jgi:hypothetical protein
MDVAHIGICHITVLFGMKGYSPSTTAKSPKVRFCSVDGVESTRKSKKHQPLNQVR